MKSGILSLGAFGGSKFNFIPPTVLTFEKPDFEKKSKKKKFFFEVQILQMFLGIRKEEQFLCCQMFLLLKNLTFFSLKVKRGGVKTTKKNKTVS